MRYKPTHGGTMTRRTKRLGMLAIVALMLVPAAIFMRIHLGNFHAVVEGEVYRSGQPDREDIARYVREYGIKSIINLRGENRSDPWYWDVRNAAFVSGVGFYDFRMKASRELTEAEAHDLLILMRDVEKPVLIHCRSGADRTGLAAALYLRFLEGKSDEEALAELGVRYGHMPYSWAQGQAMDRTYAREAAKWSLAVEDSMPMAHTVQ